MGPGDQSVHFTLWMDLASVTMEEAGEAGLGWAGLA